MANLTRQQIQRNIEALEKQGANPRDIQEWLNSLKSTQSITPQKSILDTHNVLDFIAPGATTLGKGAQGAATIKGNVKSLESLRKTHDLAFGKLVSGWEKAKTPEQKEMYKQAMASSAQAYKKASNELTGINTQVLKELPTQRQVIGAGISAVGGVLASGSLGTAGKATGISTKIPGIGKVIGAVTKAPATYATAGKRILAPMITSGAAGLVSGIGKGLEQNKTIQQSLMQGVKTGAVGAGITGVTAGTAELLKKTPHFLARTSGTSPKAMKKVVEKPELIQKAVEGGKSPDVVLKEIQSATQETRNTLTKEYGQALKKLAGKYKGQKMALTDKERGLLAKVGDQFGIDELKTYRGITDVKIGFTKTNNVLKTLNSVEATKEKGQAALVALREAKKLLKGKAINTFGGKEGKYAELIKTYATQKTKYDQIAKLTSAWNLIDEQIKSGGAGKDLMKQASATKRLSSLYREPNVEALKALEEFGKTKGKDFTGLIAGSQFKDILPIGQGGLSNIFKNIVFPLTSPRAAAAEARTLSKSHPALTGAYKVLLNRIISGRPNK